MSNATASPTLPPATVAAWHALLLQGGDPLPALQAARERALALQGQGVFIHHCSAADWAAQLATLVLRLAEHGDRAALLQRYPLLGQPFVVKDNIDVAGAPSTAACPAYAHVATTSATAVRKLLDAGALWLAKTNLDQFATGLVGTRSPYGRPACVADASRISGGSSSGSAVAVARGVVPFALGTDTAGSGRVPAGFNGLVGLKPTPGRVSTAGVLPACRTLDCVSVFAHGVGDAAAVLSVIEGADPADVYSTSVAGPAAPPAQLRIGVPAAPHFSGDAGYAAAWQAALEQARLDGHHLVDIDFAPLQAVAALLYDGPWVAERHAVVRALLADTPEALDPTVRQVIEKALAFSATDTFAAQYRLRATAGAAGHPVAAGRRAAGAHRARPPDASPRSMPIPWARTRSSGCTPTSSTCSAGRRWPCRRARRRPACRSASPSSARAGTTWCWPRSAAPGWAKARCRAARPWRPRCRWPWWARICRACR